MFIISKKSNIVVDVFTYDESSYKNNPPLSANQCLPGWWKQLPSAVGDVEFPQIKWATMKKCLGFVTSFNYGFMIKTHKDLQFDLNFNKDAKYESIELPWIVKEKTGVVFTVLQPTWNLQDLNRSISIVPKNLNFTTPCQYRVDLIINRRTQGDDEKIEIVEGTMLSHIIPLVDKKIEIKTHLVSKQEYELMSK